MKDTNDFDSGAEQEFEKAERNQDSNKEITIAFVGHVGVGKTPLVKACFGTAPNDVDSGTDGIYKLPLGDGIYILDTPGLGDVRQDRSALTRESFASLDILVVVVDFTIGAKDAAHLGSTMEFIELCRQNAKPFIVCFNKIDAVRETERGARDLGWQEALQLSDGERLFTAGFPLHGQAIGIDELKNWMLDTVFKSGADIRLAKHMRDIDAAADALIVYNALQAAVIGTIPIPLADYFPLTALQSRMIIKLGHLYGKQLGKEDAIAIMGATVTGNIAKQLFRAAVQIMKGLGWLGGPFGEGPVAVIAGAIAAATTYGLGHGAKAYAKGSADLSELGHIYSDMYQQWSERNAKKAA